jgi:hypothetical protein
MKFMVCVYTKLYWFIITVIIYTSFNISDKLVTMVTKINLTKRSH